MHPPPVALLCIYLYGLCGVAYAGKPLSILGVQQEVGVLLVHILEQGGVCASQGSGFLILVAQDVDSACWETQVDCGCSAT